MTTLLSTGQLAMLFDLPKHTIRHYIDEQLLIPKVNEQNGYQQFSEKDVYRLYQIIFLRNIGLSIEKIKTVLKEDTIVPSLRDTVEELDNKINELKKTQETVKMILSTNQQKMIKEMAFVERERRFLKEVPLSLLKAESIDLLAAHHLGFSHLELFYFLVDESGVEKIYVQGTPENHDRVLEKRVYAYKDIEMINEGQLTNELGRLFKDPLFKVSPEKEIICYENIYRSLGHSDKIFMTVEIGL